MLTLLLLIRHGENDVMYRRLAARLPDVHLNQRGREQAAALAQALTHAPIEAIYSSPLERAVETAQPLADARGLPVEIRSDLIEVNYGSWQGKTYAQLRRTNLWKTVHSAPSQVRFPDGEAFPEIQNRVVNQLKLLINSVNGDHEHVIAAVAHGDIIRLALAHYLNIPLDDFQRLYISPASLSLVRFSNSDRPQVLTVNQVAGYTWPQAPQKGKKKT